MLLQYLATRGYNKTLLMEEVLQCYLGDELAERKKIHEEEMKELSKSVSHTIYNTIYFASQYTNHIIKFFF